MPAAISNELWDLASRYANGEVTAEAASQLSAAVRSNRDLQEWFVSYMSLHAQLQWEHNSPRTATQAPALIGPASEPARASAPVTVLGFLHAGLQSGLQALGNLSPLMLCLVLSVTAAFWGLLMVALVPRHAPHVAHVHERRLPHDQAARAAIRVVATLTAAKGCVWQGQWPQVGDALPASELILETGTAELTFPTGVQLVAVGPSTLNLKSASETLLQIGRVLAKVPAAGVGFTIQTPTARVVDLGTEFGVDVDEQGLADVHVFRGIVEVESASGQPAEGPRAPLRLTAGQSVHVDLGGVSEVRTSPSKIAFMPSSFDAANRDPNRLLDLVDIAAGGNGTTHRRNRGIDPTNGEVLKPPYANNPRFGRLRPTAGYHRVKGEPFIDGVATPGRGNTPMPLDSAGHSFAGFGIAEERCDGPVWAGDYVPEPRGFRTALSDGIDYCGGGHRILFMHANKLITFDLEALRREHPDRILRRFRTVVGNSEIAGDLGRELTADAWIFVDGRVEFKRRGIGFDDGPEEADIELASDARFLTLASTDGGDAADFDWIIFADPVIETEVQARSPATGPTK